MKTKKGLEHLPTGSRLPDGVYMDDRGEMLVLETNEKEKETLCYITLEGFPEETANDFRSAGYVDAGGVAALSPKRLISLGYFTAPAQLGRLISHSHYLGAL